MTVNFSKEVISQYKRVEQLRDRYASKLALEIDSLQKELGTVKSGAVLKKIPIVDEPPKTPEKCHWDYLLKEILWLQEDFVSERKWKTGQWKKLGKEAMKHKYIVDRESGVDIVGQNLLKISHSIAAEVDRFWKGVYQLAQHRMKQFKEIAKRERNRRKLDELVEHTERIVELKSGVSTPKGDEFDSVVPLSKRQKITNESPPTVTDSWSPVDSTVVASTSKNEQERILNKLTSEMAEAQPTGFSFSTSNVTVPVPALFRGSMREYQHIGLDWMAKLHDKGLNGILADEMGLGKTIQTIALIAHLASTLGVWGPHLVVVPTSVMINWEIEFKKFCPGLKVLVYFGNPKERRDKRVGWSDPNAFHVCICSYALVLQDATVFRKKKWYYLILDEAHQIKNFKSMRWQNLLSFKTERRLLLTGTPLQNDLIELWSLLHFLMPSIFTSHSQFQEWFSEPLSKAIEHSQLDAHKGLISRLHALIKPFLLRRLKRDVEKQMPSKYEHVVPIPLSERQQYLYDEFLNHRETRKLLSAKLKGEKTDYLGLMNVLMQLRKICNHPDLIEPRQVEAPFVMALGESVGATSRMNMPAVFRKEDSVVESYYRESSLGLRDLPGDVGGREAITSPGGPPRTTSLFDQFIKEVGEARRNFILRESKCMQNEYLRKGWAALLAARQVERETRRGTLTGSPKHELILRDTVKFFADNGFSHQPLNHSLFVPISPTIVQQCHLLTRRVVVSDWDLEKFFVTRDQETTTHEKTTHNSRIGDIKSSLGHICHLSNVVGNQFQCRFPDKSLLIRDSGKFRVLHPLLTRLRAEGHKVILFTQMSKMLDVIEAFANMCGFSYVRLDGSTKVTDRQLLVDKFNRNKKLFLFISSTRAGGVGINLTGADTVVFFDSDWNPAMDKQAMDRCHRIGQSRDVHIYRLVSESTIEENIFIKQLQKRKLDEVVMDGGSMGLLDRGPTIMPNQSIDDLLSGVFVATAGSGDKPTMEKSFIYGTHVLWEREQEVVDSAPGLDPVATSILAQVEDVEDVTTVQSDSKEVGKEGHIRDPSSTDAAYNALPGIVKNSVVFAQKIMEEAEKSQEDHEWEELQNAEWESDDEGDESD